MAKGYWIGLVDVSDVDAYKAYVAANAGPIGRFGGRFLIRGGRREVVEGTPRSRNVVIEFDSFETALACYRSDDYQALIRLRTNVASSDIIVIEGYEGPQP